MTTYTTCSAVRKFWSIELVANDNLLARLDSWFLADQEYESRAEKQCNSEPTENRDCDCRRDSLQHY